MQVLNYSRQRKAIIDFLMSRKDHPTADVIYKAVREEFPKISLGTVYRNLNLLSEVGTIRKVKGLGDSEHFDADVSEHQHFICRNCGSVEDIYLSDEAMLASINQAAQQQFSGEITQRDFYFLGSCRNCIAEARNGNISQAE